MNNARRGLLILISILLGVLIGARTSLSQCTIRTTPVGFGNYDVFSNTPLDSTGTIAVNCLSHVPKVNITLGASSASGTFNPRRMKRSAGSDLLSYNIYTDVARTTIFGDGSGGTADIKLKKPHGKPDPWSETVTIYGRIPPGQDVSAGSYSDNLTATVDW